MIPTPDDPTVPSSLSSVLALEGEGVLEWLHRISTQYLVDLGPGEARPTLFCDFRGRLQYRAVVCAASDGAVWLLRDDGPGALLATFLDRQIFREPIRVRDLSASWRVDAVAREGAAGHVTDGGAPPRVVQLDGYALEVRPSEEPPAARVPLESERERIARGRPAQGHEISEEFTPFEVGLGHEVHLDKGCFPGQEALMRLITYRSVRRQLARVRGVGAPPTTPRDLRTRGDRKAAGRLTSVAGDGPEHWIGLAVLSREALASALEVNGSGTIEAAEFFPTTRPLGRS